MLSSFVFVLFLGFVCRITEGANNDIPCRSGYKYLEKTQACYKFQKVPETWNQAKIKCERESTTLFYPLDNEEVETVIQYWNQTNLFFDNTFIGAADWIVEDIFETVDGKPMSDIYNNWIYGEPNNLGGKDGCVVLQQNGLLRDDNCHNRYPYICKIPKAKLQFNEICGVYAEGYSYNKNLKKCYKIHIAPKNWTDADAICKAEQSYLAIINSELESRYLIHIIANAHALDVKGDHIKGAVYLGFRNKEDYIDEDHKSEQFITRNYRESWVTVDGKPLHLSGYNKWGHSHREGDNEHCGGMYYTRQLASIACYQKLFFICEHDL